MNARGSVEAQYRDSSKLAARMNLHRKYGHGGGVWSLLDGVGLPPASRVLEVGCGTGQFWRRVAEAFPADLSLTLTDLSPGMVYEALATVRAIGKWGDVQGEVADVCALPFADATFDAVLAMHMLYHATDTEAAVAEIARVLRPGAWPS